MKKFIVGTLTAVSVMLSVSSSHATSAIDSLRSRLSAAGTTADSITILYDIYDLSDRNDRAPVAWQMLDIAERSGNDALGLDMLRHLANIYTRNDSVLQLLQQKCGHYPESDDHAATQTFISLRRAGLIARYASEAERLKQIKETISQYQKLTPDASPYQNIERLGTLCILLGNGTHMAMLTDYIDKSLDMVKYLPETDFAVRNIIYNQASSIYTNINQTDKAIDADKKLLSIMDDMTRFYHKNGRRYRNYDTIRYSTYRNLLQNYSGLSSREIQLCYDSINAIAARNADVAADMRLNVANAYYLMAVKDYAGALPMLENIIETSSDNFNMMRALRNIITAAKAIGDNDALLRYTTRYNNALEDYARLSAQETYNELQTIYNVNELQMRNTRLELDHAEGRVRHQRHLLIYGIICLAVMLIIVCILIKVINKSRTLARSLASSNDALKSERANLLETQKKLIAARDEAKRAEQYKSDFIDNISREINNPLNAIVEYSHLIVDCADNDKKQYLRRYADIVRLNTELLSTTVRDLLDVGELDDPSLSVKRYPVLLGDLCSLAIGSMRSRLQPGVTISFEQENAPDVYITTDSRRVEQVLINLLSNAAKFTSEGTISLSYIIDRPNNSVTFAVSDTGIGIPEGKEEEIFDRFRKLDRTTQGSGLGLAICRMIADLLGGSVRVDTSHKGKGANFLFTIPIS